MSGLINYLIAISSTPFCWNNLTRKTTTTTSFAHDDFSELPRPNFLFRFAVSAVDTRYVAVAVPLPHPHGSATATTTAAAAAAVACLVESGGGGGGHYGMYLGGLQRVTRYDTTGWGGMGSDPKGRLPI